MGLRVVERAIRDALGVPPLPQPHYPVGRRFHHLSGELRWVRSSPQPVADLWQLARTTGRHDEWEYADWSDPGPLALHAARRLLRGRGQAPTAGSR
jgi:hypothetical protein